MKKVLIRVVGLLIIAAAALTGYRFVKQFDQKQQTIPTTAVRQSDVIIRSYTRGELRAVRSTMLIAPNLFGTVQVTRLAPLGAIAREKDLIVEFDDSEVQSRLEEKELELEQLDEQLKKATAELEIRNNQDQVDLLRSRYSVRRAELEVKRNELLSSIDQKKNLLTLEEARRRLKQLESDIKSRLEQSQAELAVLREKKNKALLEYSREKQRLSQVKLLAPMDGLVAIRQNRGGMNFMRMGMQVPDIREGDQVFPGSPIADVLDLSELEVAAKVGELDRANLHEGQDVTMRLDAVPDKLFHGKIKSLSGTASANIWSGDPAKKFDVVFSLDMKELLSGLGAKPEQIRRVLETAEKNRSKPPTNGMGSPMMMAMGSGGGFGGFTGAGGPGGAAQMMGTAGGGAQTMGMQGGAGDQGSTGGEQGQTGEARQGRGGAGGGMRFMRGGGDMTPEQQQKMREAVQKILNGRNLQDLSPEERQKFREQIQALMQGSGGAKPEAGQSQRERGAAGAAGEGGARGERGARNRSGAEGGAEGTPRMGFSQGPAGQGGQGGEGRAQRGEGGGQRGEGRGGPGGGFGFGGAQRFTEKDLENAKLPPPPGADSQLEVLLRPGLLADVEIIVEKVPKAIHIPIQAVFDKEGRPVVYVRRGDRFEERQIKPLKRSESVMVIAEGLKQGEMVALADPFARKDGKGKKAESGGSKKGGMPGAGGPGGGGR